MDIRDIKEVVEYPGPRTFKEIFELQKELLSGYIGLEKGLPQYPLDLNTRDSQNLLKDFTGRIIEELGEGFESYKIMMDLFHSGVDHSEMIPHLQNFNEEIADALHFWLELLIYSGFETSHLLSWVIDFDTYKDNDLSTRDLLIVWLKTGAKYVEEDMDFCKPPCRMVIKDKDVNDKFLMGGRKLGIKNMNIMKQYLWDVTYHLQIARNTLKNKPWKQTEMMTDTNLYEECQKKATLALFKFLSFTGFTHESIYEIYYKKNQVNQFRQRSKY